MLLLREGLLPFVRDLALNVDALLNGGVLPRLGPADVLDDLAVPPLPAAAIIDEVLTIAPYALFAGFMPC